MNAGEVPTDMSPLLVKLNWIQCELNNRLRAASCSAEGPGEVKPRELPPDLKRMQNEFNRIQGLVDDARRSLRRDLRILLCAAGLMVVTYALVGVYELISSGHLDLGVELVMLGGGVISFFNGYIWHRKAAEIGFSPAAEMTESLFGLIKLARWTLGKKSRDHFALALGDLERDRREMLAEGRSPIFVLLCFVLRSFGCFIPVVLDALFRFLKLAVAADLVRKIIGKL